LKKYELEAFIKSFFIFFILQLAFLAHVVWHQYNTAIKNLDNKIASEMKICSLDLQCKNYQIDFVEASNYEKEKLYKSKDKVYMLFSVPTVQGFLLQIYLDKKSYEKKIQELQLEIFKHNILYFIFIFFSSFFFAMYSLYPLRKALALNEEFIKDILHDINTPISALVINLKLLQKEFGDNKKILRAKNSIDTIVALQENLKAFLYKSKLQKEQFSLKKILEERVKYFQSLYPNISFEIDVTNAIIYTNKNSFIRIIDNILSNSCKYSQKSNAKIKIVFKGNILIIEDNGIGIENVKKLFERYYKEQSRGLGLGMHIVKKLSEELGIEIKVESEVNKGTKVFLDLGAVILS